MANNGINLTFSLLLIVTYLWWTNHINLQPIDSSSKAIFILAGQSNMAGRGGVIDRCWDGIVPPEMVPNPGKIIRLSGELRWEEAEEPLHEDIDVNKTCGVGPGMAFANALVKADPGRFPVVGLVPCAVGGSGIEEWSRGGRLYEELMRRAVAAAAEGGGEIRGVLWFQGERDTVNQSDAESYKGKLERLFLDMRADLGSPILPVIQVALASGEGLYVETVREAQQGIRLQNVMTIDAKGLPLQPDGLHLSTAAQVKIGEMLARAFLQSK